MVATAFLGANDQEPVSTIVDPSTDTVYVGNAGIASASPPVPPSISVLDGATCNASVTSGCSAPLATIELTGFPGALALDPATGTLYVASPFPAGAVFVIDAAGCNTATTAGCTNAVKTINDSLSPDGIAVDTEDRHRVRGQRRIKRAGQHRVGDRRGDVQCHAIVWVRPR